VRVVSAEILQGLFNIYSPSFSLFYLSLLFSNYHLFLCSLLLPHISSSQRTSFTANEFNISNSSDLYTDFYDTFESSASVNSTVDLYMDYSSMLKFNASVNSTAEYHHHCFGSTHINKTEAYYIYLVGLWLVQAYVYMPLILLS